MASSRLPVA